MYERVMTPKTLVQHDSISSSSTPSYSVQVFAYDQQSCIASIMAPCLMIFTLFSLEQSSYVQVFDPLGLSDGAAPGDIKRWREAEIKHGRVAMLASLGVIVAEVREMPFNIYQYARRFAQYFVVGLRPGRLGHGRSIGVSAQSLARAPLLLLSEGRIDSP